MAAVNSIVTRAFDLALAPFAGHPWLGLVLISLLTGAVLLLVFRYTSNQRGIRAAKDRIISHLLEVLLYRDEMRVVVRAQARLFLDNLRYLGYALVPLAFMLVPVAFLLVQTDLRYGSRPLHVGDKAIVELRLRPGVDLDQVSISAPAGIAVETDSLRIPSLDEVDWRLRATAPGKHVLRFTVAGRELTKEIVVGQSLTRVSTARVADSAWEQFKHPGEPPIPRDVPVLAATITYPSAHLDLFGHHLHWVWPWLIISMAFGYALKGPLRVQV
jgi:hypothetical protein